MGEKLPNKSLPDSISIYLDEIARRLWSGHASIMVGTGFSKNAKANSQTAPPFPDWPQLGNSFYEKLYNRIPDGKQNYLNPLKLAEEVQAAFGRPALDDLIRFKIPDDFYEPSDLHIKLLDLPWVDVFTTNYDTLLERACKNVSERKYDIVINKEDLIYSSKPRIIKLHGSFPSKRPFIATEEDYRKYPVEYAPFVNTVQQALIENTLCLIGFSGNDPNFLQWIGWIRDNLGKENSPKIYMIGIFNLSDAEKKLLEKRNIVLVDMAVCPDIGKSDHATAQLVCINYLMSKKEKDNRLEWPMKYGEMSPKDDADILPQIKDITHSWTQQRKNYPGWVIVPEDRRSTLWLYTKYWTIGKLFPSNIEPPLDIYFLHELNWRLEKCLCPITIFSYMVGSYERILDRYNPFPDIVDIPNSLNATQGEQNSKLDWKMISQEWVDLHFALLRYYREDGLLDKWIEINKRIEKLTSKLSPENLSRWYYEKALYALFSLNITQLKQSLALWPINESLPFWEAKRAGLLAELGDTKEAELILEKSLQTIRFQLNLSPVTNDYTRISKESYIMLLLRNVKTGINFVHRNLIEPDELRQQFDERWNFHKQFKCDPWNEWKLFKIMLEREPVYKPSLNKKHCFDIGHISVSYSFIETNTEALTAYSFLRYCEEIGLPFRAPGINIGKEIAEGTIKRISQYSPYWALATLLRIGDSKQIDTMFNRQAIAQLPTPQVDKITQGYMDVLCEVKPEIEKGDVSRKRNIALQLAGVIPEILSRLCVKCSQEIKDKILDLIVSIYKSEHRNKYEGVAHLLQRLLTSWSDDEKMARLKKIIEIPIIVVTHPRDGSDFPEPFKYLNVNKKDINNQAIQIEQKTIESLIEKVKSKNVQERERALYRVAGLNDLGFLSDQQKKEFADALWSQTDTVTGFPINTNFYKYGFAIGLFPHPELIDPIMLFKQYIKNTAFPIQKGKKDKGVNITEGERGAMVVCVELLGSTKKPFTEKGIEWSLGEALELFGRLYDWWQADKGYLKAERDSSSWGSISKEFQARFSKLVEILSETVLPQLSPKIDDETKSKLTSMLNELEENEVPCTTSKVATLVVFPEKLVEIVDAIYLKTIATNRKKVENAFEGIWTLLVLYSKGKITNLPSGILSPIIECIKYRRYPFLISAIQTLSNVIKYIPNNVTEKEIQDVLIGLDYLADETDMFSKESPIENEDKLLTRLITASLASELCQMFTTKKMPITREIKKWRDICRDKEEYPEIRNQWRCP
jgi:hypothetical protein